MKDINKMILVGRLGAHPEKKVTRKGKELVRFPLATTRRFKKESATQSEEGKWEKETSWHQVVAWGKNADFCMGHLQKGYTVYVEGSLRMKNYTDSKGVNRKSVEVHADEVCFLGSTKTVVDDHRPVSEADLKTVEALLA